MVFHGTEQYAIVSMKMITLTYIYLDTMGGFLVISYVVSNNVVIKCHLWMHTHVLPKIMLVKSSLRESKGST